MFRIGVARKRPTACRANRPTNHPAPSRFHLPASFDIAKTAVHGDDRIAGPVTLLTVSSDRRRYPSSTRLSSRSPLLVVRTGPVGANISYAGVTARRTRDGLPLGKRPLAGEAPRNRSAGHATGGTTDMDELGAATKRDQYRAGRITAIAPRQIDRL